MPLQAVDISARKLTRTSSSYRMKSILCCYLCCKAWRACGSCLVSRIFLDCRAPGLNCRRAQEDC
jgi:hypothetical protein